MSTNSTPAASEASTISADLFLHCSLPLPVLDATDSDGTGLAVYALPAGWVGRDESQTLIEALVAPVWLVVTWGQDGHQVTSHDTAAEAYAHAAKVLDDEAYGTEQAADFAEAEDDTKEGARLRRRAAYLLDLARQTWA